MLFVMTACAENSSQSEKSQPAEQTTVQPTTMSAEEINDRKLDKFISDMTLEEKVGQMFLGRCRWETGAEEFTLKRICVYSVTGRNRVNSTGAETFGVLYFAEITSFGRLKSEIAEIVLLEDFPSAGHTRRYSPRS